MEKDELALYSCWLACSLEKDKNNEKQFVQDSFTETLQKSAAYQDDATVNGKLQPMVATRTETKKCKVTLIPGTMLYIGDLVNVFGEYWICVEMYIDEYEMRYGELWMCNQIFCFQNRDLEVIHKYAILDDGSYSTGSDKAIQVTDNGFKCYISLDNESKSLYVDKRLAINVIYDSKGKEILEVGQIKWIDIKSRNFGEGSHLMLFGIKDDAFNAEKDNVDELICDYIEPHKINYLPSQDEESKSTALEKLYGVELTIEGKTAIRIGSNRTYTIKAKSYEDNTDVVVPNDLEWRILQNELNITIQKESEQSCKVCVPENSNLIGQVFRIICESTDGKYKEGTIDVEVI